jgi:hypothetical protein
MRAEVFRQDCPGEQCYTIIMKTPFPLFIAAGITLLGVVAGG